MRKRPQESKATDSSPLRCAIYTRKSTEEGLDQEFNSLDAQREAGEAFIQSQRREGWIVLPDLFDDGGFTGANMDRPALARLLKAVEAGELDCVVVYKVDRLSRSLLDFTSMFRSALDGFCRVTQLLGAAAVGGFASTAETHQILSSQSQLQASEGRLA